MGELTEFEQLTLDQILIGYGRDKPTKTDIEHAKRIVRDCNFHRRLIGLEEF